MQPPEVRERIAREARWHLQLAIESLDVEQGQARVSGHVVRVFRGAPDLLGKKLTLPVLVLAPGEGNPPGGVRKPPEQIRVGRVLEAFVNETSEGLSLPLNLCLFLEEATHTPQHLLVTSPALPERKRGRLLAVLVAGLVAASVAYWIVAGLPS